MSRNKRSRSSYSWFRCVGAAAGIAFGVAALGYYVYQVKFSVESEDTQNTAIKSKSSRCIVMTKSLCELKRIDWLDLLESDVVLLVAPGVTLPDQCAGSVHHKYKIIYCETFTGIWACVRHLGKDQLIFNSNEVVGGVPVDIPRYVKELFDSQNSRSSFLSHV